MHEGNQPTTRHPHIDNRGDANAEATACLSGLFLLLSPVVILHQLQSFPQHGWVIAAVIEVARGDGVGKSRGRNKVAPPDFCRVKVKLTGGHIHQSLQDKVVDWRAEATIGSL